MRIVTPTEEAIHEAASRLLAGELVGMPTETVYGIAAVATNEQAVRQTFAVKGRPADNPLIVHLAHLSQLNLVVSHVPEMALRLAERFWPGPLTLVMPKRSRVPDVTTGGLATVAVRVPAHPVALRLIDATGEPLSAPSANPFMGLSPTRAEDIDPGVGDKLAIILDGGPCSVGVESTVVDCTGVLPKVLRPGRVSVADIESALGLRASCRTEGERSSPGMYPRHYAPHTEVVLVDRLGPEDAGITFFEPLNQFQVQLPGDSIAFAVSLYATLHRLDAVGLHRICIQKPPKAPEWDAVWDRLAKAATPDSGSR